MKKQILNKEEKMKKTSKKAEKKISQIEAKKQHLLQINTEDGENIESMFMKHQGGRAVIVKYYQKLKQFTLGDIYRILNLRGLIETKGVQAEFVKMGIQPEPIKQFKFNKKEAKKKTTKSKK